MASDLPSNGCDRAEDGFNSYGSRRLARLRPRNNAVMHPYTVLPGLNNEYVKKFALSIFTQRSLLKVVNSPPTDDGLGMACYIRLQHQ
jgi:hypothetical protein